MVCGYKAPRPPIPKASNIFSPFPAHINLSHLAYPFNQCSNIPIIHQICQPIQRSMRWHTATLLHHSHLQVLFLLLLSITLFLSLPPCPNQHHFSFPQDITVPPQLLPNFLLVILLLGKEIKCLSIIL